MINYTHENLFKTDSIFKTITITDNSTINIGNSDLKGEELTLTEILCDEEELDFGSCCSAELKFTTTYATDLIGKELTFSCVLGAYTTDPFVFGTYKVVEEKVVERQGNYNVKEVVAYDSLYEVLNANVIDWYDTLLPNSSSSCTLKQFRDSFFNHFGITQETITLDNDNMTVNRTVGGKSLSGALVLRSICATNGCFGRINRDGKFEYFYLTPIAQDLSNAYEIGENGYYMSENHEIYTVNSIDKLIIRDEDIEEIITVGSGNNAYVMGNNLLLYGKGATELSTIAQNIYNRITGITYVPFDCDVKGNPCFEIGDPIYLTTVQNDTFVSYILRREYTGVQAQRDYFSAKGEEKREEAVNSVDTQLYQLRGKSNKLERNVDETISVITNQIFDGAIPDPTQTTSLETQITQNATDITNKVSKTSPTGQTSFSWQMTDSKMEWKENGNRIMLLNSSGLEVKGKISATSGFIGQDTSNGFTISAKAIYNGTNSMSSTTRGIYVGTDGINAGYNFRVEPDGFVNCTSARYGKVKINSSDINSGDIVFYGTALNTTVQGKIYLDPSDSNYMNIEATNYLDISATDGLTFNSKAYNKCLLQTNTTSSGNYRVLYGENLTDNTETAGARKGGLLYNPLLHRLYIGGTSNGAMLEYPSTQTFLFRASNEADYGVNLGVMDSMWTFCPIVDDKMALGTANHKWRTVYAVSGTINTSDRNEKKDITELGSKILDFVLKLKPVSYKFKVGKRIHFGLVAQDVEQTMTELGLTDMDFAGFCKDQKTKRVKKKVEIDGVEREIDVDEPIKGQYTYGLRYEEFIAPIIKFIQLLYKEIVEIKSELKEIKKLLKEKVNE